MLEKDFTHWHDRKEVIHCKKRRPFFRERDVWFCSLGVNVGFEQDGRGQQFLRPVVIVRKFNNEICWGLPLTKNAKQGPYYLSISPVAGREASAVILSQLRLIDVKRLQYKVGAVSEEEFREIKKRLIALLQ